MFTRGLPRAKHHLDGGREQWSSEWDRDSPCSPRAYILVEEEKKTKYMHTQEKAADDKWYAE